MPGQVLCFFSCILFYCWGHKYTYAFSFVCNLFLIFCLSKFYLPLFLCLSDQHLGILRCGDAMVFFALKERLRLDDDSRVRYEAAKSLILLGMS